MVSRYERERSSPFNRIHEISKALDVTPAQLLQEDNNASNIRYYEVPLFTHIPDNNDFSENNTTYYYSAPKRIFELGVYVYAVEARLIKNDTIDLRNTGIVYISDRKTNTRNQSGIYLSTYSERLVFTSKTIVPPIGLVLAQEIKFV